MKKLLSIFFGLLTLVVAVRVKFEDVTGTDVGGEPAEVADGVHATGHDAGITTANVDTAGPGGPHGYVVPERGGRNEQNERPRVVEVHDGHAEEKETHTDDQPQHRGDDHHDKRLADHYAKPRTSMQFH